jgi:hypothetical protein
MFDCEGAAAASRAATLPLAGEIRSAVDALAAPGEGLTDVERVDLIGALEVLKSAAAATQARLTADLDASVRARHAAMGLPADKQGRGVGAEVALARRESPTRGGQHLGLAKALVHEMPHTLTALTQGRISEWRATVLVRETACLTREDRGRVDEELAADPARLEGLGDRRVAAEARRLAYRLDPSAALARARKAEGDRRVTLRPAPDTMTYLTALLPVRTGSPPSPRSTGRPLRSGPPARSAPGARSWPTASSSGSPVGPERPAPTSTSIWS